MIKQRYGIYSVFEVTKWIWDQKCSLPCDSHPFILLTLCHWSEHLYEPAELRLMKTPHQHGTRERNHE